MAIVNKPDKEGRVTLYDIPDAELQRYAIPTDKLAQMFPMKDNPKREDAVSVGTPPSGGADVQAYSADSSICYYYCCNAYGVCGWCWYYC